MFTIIYGKEKQRILTFEKLELSFLLTNTIIKTAEAAINFLLIGILMNQFLCYSG